MIKGAIRRLLTLLSKSDPDAKATIQAALLRDDYDTTSKPAIDWDDEDARAALVDELVRDALGALAILEGKELAGDVVDAAELLATVAGQDVESDDAGTFRIPKGVARDRIVSVVDPDARHGRKSCHGHFDGYKAHVAVDPTTELVTEVEVTPANAPDAEPVKELLPELRESCDPDDAVTVVADSAYGSGATRREIRDAGGQTVIKAPPEQNSHGGFLKSAFRIDLDAKTATCPAGVTTATAATKKDGSVEFRFPAETCASCPLRAQCTTSTHARIGRRVVVGPHEELLAEARVQQQTDEFKTIYNGERPTVEPVIYRVVRNGGRKARYRGRAKVTEQIRMKAAAENLVRMLRLGLAWTVEAGWAIA